MKLATLLENKLDDAIKKYGHDHIGVLNQLYSGDPSDTKKYFNWMVKEHINNPKVSPSHIVNLIETYHQNINKITPENLNHIPIADKILSNPKDINQYELSDLNNLIQNLDKIKSKSEIKREGSRVIYEDERWLVLSPLTVESSCYYGSGTKWCTAARENNRFAHYTSNGYLIYFLDKSRPSGRYYRMALLVTFLVSDNGIRTQETWYDEEDHTFSGDIKNLLPPQLVSKVNEYAQSLFEEKTKNHKSFTIGEIRDMLIVELDNSTIQTELGDFDIYYDTFAGLIEIRPGKRVMGVMPKIQDFYCYATPLWEDELKVPLSYYWLDENGDDHTDDYSITFLPDSIRELMRFNVKTPEIIKRLFDETLTEYKERVGKSIVNYIHTQVPNIYRTWSRGGQSTYSFKYPPKKGGWTDLFVNYVMRRQRRGLPATKRDFYKTVLGYKIDVDKMTYEQFKEKFFPLEWIENHTSDPKERNKKIKNGYLGYVARPDDRAMLNIRGHNSSFFSAITDAGILKRDGKFYSLGPNYESWKSGYLKKI